MASYRVFRHLAPESSKVLDATLAAYRAQEMVAAFKAVQRYQAAGLADEAQANLLRHAFYSDKSAALLDRAIAAARSITLTEFEAAASSTTDIDDWTRYTVLFGRLDGRINHFAMSRDEIAEAMARAVARGTPMTEDEIVWLDRNVIKDGSVVY